MKKFLLTIGLVFSLIFANIVVGSIHADDTNCNCSDLGCLDRLTTCLSNLNSALSMSVNATRPLESQLISLQRQIAGIQASIANIQNDVAEKKIQIDKGYQDLASKEALLNAKIRDLYIKNYSNSPLTLFLSSSNASDWTEKLAYQKAVADQDKLIITNIALTVDNLQTQKIELEQKQQQLASMKISLDDQSSKLDKVVQGAKAYQAQLTNQIAQLSAQQQNLLAQKYASLGISHDAYNMSGGCSSDLLPGAPDPGFSPKIAFFSFGVPNRVGMNQYGAKGRADSGQNAQQILQAYYNANYTTGYNQSITIHVVGTNEYGQSFDDNWSIEEYLKHVYEIPASWPSEALKAQAIAARSYALSYTSNGSKSICPSQSCQVVKKEQNSSAWVQAVNDTAGIVLTSGGNPITAWFSSTHGGYVHSSGGDISGAAWTKEGKDATDDSINSFSDLMSKAYDGPSHANSPWFYCDWGSRNGTAWLKPSEVADIANVVKLAQITNQDQGVTKHLLQLDKDNPDGNWDEARVRQELQNRGTTPLNSVNDISISADFGSGKTTTITVNGDTGSMSFPGDFFKTYFNLRAPKNIQIVGPLYNVEKR